MQSVKEFRKTLVLAALAAVPMTAAHAASQLDVYYTPYTMLKGDSDAGSVKFDNGDGYGAKGRFGVIDNVFASLEYERNTYDSLHINGSSIFTPDSKLRDKTEEYRAGLGYTIPTTPFYVEGEYIRLDNKQKLTFDTGGAAESNNDKNEGWGAHMGAQGKVLNDVVTLNAEIGYVDVGHGNGLEALAGVAYNVTQNVGLFADYRLTSLTGGGDSNPATRIEEARIGARLSF
jgi:opacity protein-like surface antigen